MSTSHTEIASTSCDCDRSSSWKCQNSDENFRCACSCHRDTAYLREARTDEQENAS